MAWVHKTGAWAAAITLLVPNSMWSSATVAQTAPQAQTEDAAQAAGGYVFKVNADLVLTNVVARNAKTGDLVRDLKQSDFSVYENGKRQQMSAFDFQSVEMATPLKEATVSGLAANSGNGRGVVIAKAEELRNHRLIVFFRSGCSGFTGQYTEC